MANTRASMTQLRDDMRASSCAYARWAAVSEIRYGGMGSNWEHTPWWLRLIGKPPYRVRSLFEWYYSSAERDRPK
jgi:hypothetical protein